MPKRRKRRGFGGFIIFLVLLLAIVIGGGVFAIGNLKACGDGTNTSVITVEENETFDEILNDLEEEGIIQSASFASLYAKFKDVSFFAGNYTFNDGMNLNEVFEYLSDSSNAHVDQLIMTVPEGKWAKQIAQIISETFGYSTDEVINLWNDEEYLEVLCQDYEFLDFDTINNANYRVKLEGYLFPETYSFNKDATIDEITRTLLNQFNVLYQEYKTDINESGYSVHEIVTLASVVQFESGSKEDMEIISSVFHNRLDQDMKLESSVTVCYALYDDFNDLKDCEVNYDVESPYNTYLFQGLPIGPILNAGEDAFIATLHPAKTDYLYFLADVNGDGTVYYFDNYEDHLAKQEELGLFY